MDFGSKYIAAKKISDVAAAKVALNDLTAIQKARIGIRSQIGATMDELADALGVFPEPVQEVFLPEV